MNIIHSSEETVYGGEAAIESGAAGNIAIDACAMDSGEKIRIWFSDAAGGNASVTLNRRTAVAMIRAVRSVLSLTEPQSATCGTCLLEDMPPLGGTWNGDAYTCPRCLGPAEGAP